MFVEANDNEYLTHANIFASKARFTLSGKLLDSLNRQSNLVVLPSRSGSPFEYDLLDEQLSSLFKPCLKEE
jgi:hypothetical protein